MQLHSTFGAFLVAFTIAHGAPIASESRLGPTTNMTTNASPSGPASNSGFGDNGLASGMIQVMKRHGHSLNFISRDDTSSEDAASKQSDGIKSGSSGTSSSGEPKKASPPGGSSVSQGAVAGTASTVNSGGNLLARQKAPTQGNSPKDNPKGSDIVSPVEASGGQETGHTTGFSQTAGAVPVVSGGSKTGSAPANADGAPSKRDTTSTERAVLKSETEGQATGTQQSTSGGDGSSSPAPSGDKKKQTQASSSGNSAGRRAVRMQAKSDNPPKSPSSDGAISSSGGSTSSSSSSGGTESSGQGGKKQAAPASSSTGTIVTGVVG